MHQWHLLTEKKIMELEYLHLSTYWYLALIFFKFSADVILTAFRAFFFFFFEHKMNCQKFHCSSNLAKLSYARNVSNWYWCHIISKYTCRIFKLPYWLNPQLFAGQCHSCPPISCECLKYKPFHIIPSNGICIISHFSLCEHISLTSSSTQLDRKEKRYS